MNLNDGMGHTPPKPTTIHPAWIITALAATIATITIALTIATTDQPTAQAPGPTIASPTTTPPPTPPPDEHGHDATSTAGAPQQAWATVERFVQGWTSTDGRTRATIFAGTATDQLARGLTETRPENVITAHRASVEVIGSGSYSAEFRIRFVDVDSPIQIILVADPDAPYDWRVTAIEKTGN